MKKNRKLNRLNNFDYSSEGLYFITSCVHDKICHLGEVVNEEMRLNNYGMIAEQQWLWLEEQYSHINLYSYSIMPNHIHGIIEIDKSKIIETDSGNTTGTNTPKEPIKIKSISELIGAYKTTTSKHIHLAGLNEFKWQRSFYDHIIRDARSFEKISNYIENNPSNWQDDRFYQKS